MQCLIPHSIKLAIVKLLQYQSICGHCLRALNSRSICGDQLPLWIREAKGRRHPEKPKRNRKGHQRGNRPFDRNRPGKAGWSHGRQIWVYRHPCQQRRRFYDIKPNWICCYRAWLAASNFHYQVRGDRASDCERCRCWIPGRQALRSAVIVSLRVDRKLSAIECPHLFPGRKAPHFRLVRTLGSYLLTHFNYRARILSTMMADRCVWFQSRIS